MKKLLFLLSLTLLSSKINSQNCLPLGLSLSSQTEVDSFASNYPGCSTIVGDLSLGGSITNLNGLSQIERILGDLRIGSDSIRNLNGLHNLRSIGESLSIYNGILENLEGLNNLEEVSSISIRSNGNFISMRGLDSLKFIPGLSLEGPFENLEGLVENSTQIGGLYIGNGVMSLVGLEHLKSLDALGVGGSTLKNFKGLEGLESISRITISVTDLNSMEGLENLTSVDRLKLRSTIGINKLDFLNKVESINQIEIINTDLSEISGFDSLKHINHLSIQSNSGLLKIDGFNKLESGTGSSEEIQFLEVRNNKKLTEISNLGVALIQNLIIADNLSLQNLDGYQNLEGVIQDLVIAGNKFLQSISALRNFTTFPKVVEINGNSLLDECELELMCLLQSNAIGLFSVVYNGDNCFDITQEPDSDGDGIIDICDSCSEALNSRCDDGNNATANDRINIDCECVGECVSELEVGDLCDDDNPDTENDQWTDACNCIGECIYAENSTCDDGNPNTSDDVWNASCECAGTCLGEIGESCNDNNERTINDVWTDQCECIGECVNALGSSCDDQDPSTFDDIWNSDCNCAGKPCPPAGTACNDGDPNTVEDVEDGFCECAGVCLGDINDACDDLDPSTFDDKITEECGCIGTPCVEAGTPCDDGDPNTFNDVEDGNCNCVGICSFTFGAPCDDQNENTFEDKWTSECLCMGDCQFVIGSPCDDGNPATENSYWDENCNCASDECEDAGTLCNDNNRLTYGDAINYQCLCEGYYQEAISGFIFHDENENGIMDPDEQGIQGVRIGVEGSRLNTYSGEKGAYKFFGDAGAYIIRPTLEGCWEPTSSSKFAVVSYRSDKIDNINFGYKLVDDVVEANVKLTSGRARCGFTVPYWLHASNTGCTPLDLKLELSLSELTTYNPGAVPLPTSRRNELITWEFDNVEPTESVSADLKLTIAGEDFNHDTIRIVSVVSYKDENGEYQPLDSYNYVAEISCAIDPNDKLVDPKLNGPENRNYTLFEDTLDYTIRFQNTGTDTAFNIVVRDTLTDLVDWSTFTPRNSSHDFIPVITEDGIVEFHFRDILLPDSTTNYVESQGFVNFTILTVEDIEELEEVKNNAGIFFDFNRPVITNEVNNTLVSTFDADFDGSPFWEDCNDNDSSTYPGAQEIANNEIDEDCSGADFTSSVEDLEILGFKIYPIPARDLVNITTEVTGNYSLILFDMMGKKVCEEQMKSQNHIIDTNNFPEGTFILLILDNTRKLAARKRLVFVK